MLNKETAEKQVKSFRFLEDEENFDDLSRQTTRYEPKIRRLPSSIRAIGEELWDLNKRPMKQYQLGASVICPMRGGREERLSQFDDLSEADREKILKIPFPKMAEEVEQAWRFLRGFPYQRDFDTRKPFRSPNHGEDTHSSRGSWLDSLFTVAEKYKEELLDPVFLAKWAPYLRGRYWTWENQIGMLLASVISRGGKQGQEVFGILHDSLLGRHEIGAMGRHVVQAFLMSTREEGWELIEKTLIAAQRQEGLRQSIVEAVDFSQPEAFLRMLKLIREHELARFSSIVRAVDVWFGFRWDSASTRVVNNAVEKAIEFLESSAARKAAIAGKEAEKADLALWATAYKDARESLKLASGLLKHKSPEMRFVAVRHLERLAIKEANDLRWTASDDVDFRVAALAVDTIDHESPPDAFERVERFLARLNAPETKVKPIVWPWTETKVKREEIAGRLCDAIGDRSPTALIPHLDKMDANGREEVVQIFGMQKKFEVTAREAVLRLAIDPTERVRTAAFEAISNLKLTPAEEEFLSNALTRKTVDLRIGILSALERSEDSRCLSIVDDLLAAKDANKRLAGLEFLRRLTDKKRAVDACRERAESFSKDRKCTKDERTQLEALLVRESERKTLTLKNGLGLMNPAKRTPIFVPRDTGVELFTADLEKFLRSLDHLVHAHREKPIKPYAHSEELIPLGAIDWRFPSPCFTDFEAPPIKDLPLAETWLDWYDKLIAEHGEGGNLLALRGWLWLEIDDGSKESFKAWSKGNPGRKKLFQEMYGNKIEKLRYGEVLKEILVWLLLLRRSDSQVNFLIDLAERFTFLVPQEALSGALPDLEAEAKERANPWSYHGNEERAPWRDHHSVVCQCLRVLVRYRFPKSPQQIERIWRLYRWIDEPIEGATRRRPDWEWILQAYLMGIAKFDDVVDAALGEREGSSGYYGFMREFEFLREMTARKLDKLPKIALEERPELRELLAKAVDTIVDSELARGETPTATTNPAHALGSIVGIKRLIQFLEAIGKTGFKTPGWGSKASLQRIPTLTRLVRVTFPSVEDTPEAFAKVMKAEVAKKGFPEDRLMELAFLAPQWSQHVQKYFEWPGMAEALYWYLAHMNFMWSSDAVENAAESAGFEDQKEAEEPVTNAEATTRTETEGEKAPKVEVLSAWEQLLRERSALTDLERKDGAIDVVWFHRVYKEIGVKRWERVAAAAKFAANAAQAKKASLIANVLLGEADLKALVEGIETRFLKDNVRLIGLFPLPKGAKRETELARRHKVLVDYGRYAKQLSGLTKPAALRALEIGLKNLASTAGYEDALRLDWALGASEWADLAKGPVKASKDGTEVTLAIDEKVMPVISVTKNGKELKAAPAAVKKEPKVAVLFERAKELRRQSSRQKQALEAAMLRGDAFSSTELVQLCEHALVAPFLTRLVLVGDGVIGYPDKGGKALRDYAGKLEPVKKGEQLRIAHSHDLFASKQWDKWQRDCFAAERIQPFKQVFRELYVATSQEKADGYKSNRYAGQQVQPRQAAALFGSRGWNTGEGVFKVFHREGIVAWLSANSGVTTPLEVEGWTIESVHFAKRGEWKPMSMADVPPWIFSEVMRDVDLVVSVAHRGGVDPEASASTVEMRANLLRETCQLLKLDNVRVQEQYALIEGFHASYSLHLGSGSVHRLPGGYLCVVPVHSQHRGRLFLPFADDDPRTAEVISKSLLLARDKEISDPAILEQLRA